MQFRCTQFCAIPRNSTQFCEYLIASFFAIPRNEIAQEEATIARNGIPIENPSFETITGSYINVNFQAFIHTFITNQEF